jgi:gluconolactonase
LKQGIRFVRLSCVLLVVGVSSAAAQSPVPEGVAVERIATGFQFVEGPLWKDGVGLLFSDIPASTVYRWTPDSGARVYLKPSFNSNGLTLDLQGRLLLTETGTRRIARLEDDGTQTPLASTYDGKKLNSPNDLVVKSTGGIFFTDPPFNIPAGEKAELTFSGIYRISPSGNLQLLDSTLNLPNGICFSPDESKLYVNNSSQRIIYVWGVVNDSTIANKRAFASISPTGYADGMKVDAAGNVFCSGPLGVWVFAPDGTVLDTILVPGQTTNCNWGDADRKTLYITSGNSVYRIRLTATDVQKHGFVIPETFELYSNYPNPFNPTTTIRYTVPVRSEITLEVYNALGQKIATLKRGELEPGSYNTVWNADAASGIYFCRIAASSLDSPGWEEVRTGKMLLLR